MVNGLYPAHIPAMNIDYLLYEGKATSFLNNRISKYVIGICAGCSIFQPIELRLAILVRLALLGKIGMPELPEVETIINDLNKNIPGLRIRDIWSDIGRFDVEKLKLKIVGNKIEKIKRFGKNILFFLTGGRIMLVHQKMTGHLMYGKWKIEKTSDGQEKISSLLKGPFQEKVNNYIHLIFYLNNGRQIALSDLRKFAKVEVFDVRSAGEIKEIKNLGPDALTVEFSDFQKNIAGEKGSVKQVLMNQKFIAGIGNIYSDEILWKAGIHPERKANFLNIIALKKIFKAMKNILKKAVKKRGTSISDFRDAAGKKGMYGNHLFVYGRKGKKCLKCASAIKRLKIGGRGSCFCPVCQK